MRNGGEDETRKGTVSNEGKSSKPRETAQTKEKIGLDKSIQICYNDSIE